MWKWFKSLREKIRQFEKYILRCPKCHSKYLQYSWKMINYDLVQKMGEEPKIVKSIKCQICGYKSESKINDTSDDYLLNFEKDYSTYRDKW